MRAGRLRHRIVLQAFVVTVDAWGTPIQAWTDMASLWASVEALHGREFFAAAQVQSEVTHKVRIRHRDGITPAMRILHGERTLQIEAILPDVRGSELVLMCKEYSNDAGN